MRAILTIVIILVLAVLISPFWFGMKAEDEYNKLIDNVSKNENLEIVSRNYERGWLESLAKIKYTYKNEENSQLVINQEDAIYHGPIPIGLISKGKVMLTPVMAFIQTNADLKSDSEEKYSEFINSLPQAGFETTLSFGGNGTTEVSVPARNKKLQSGTALNWLGLDGLIHFSPDLNRVSSVFNSPGLEIEDNNAIVSISGINLESNLNYPTSNYKNPLGDMLLKIDELSSEGKDEEGDNKVTLRNFEIAASTNQTGNLLNHNHNIGIESITVGGNTYGPGIYELEIRNIDKVVFEKIQVAINESQNSEGTYATEMITAKLMEILPKLIESSSEIEITQLSVKTNEGEITGHAIISASGDSLDNPELAANPIFLLAAISAEMDLSVSQLLFENLLRDYKIEEITDEINSRNEKLPSEEEIKNLAQVRAQAEVQEMLDRQILILKNGKYQIEARYSLGQVFLNGNPLDLGSIINQL